MPSAFSQGVLQTPLATALGGTGLSSLGTALYVLRVNAAGTALEYAAAGTGTVTSVDITLPTGLVVTGNPITTTGTLAIDTDIGYVIPLQSSIDDKAPLISPTFDTSINASFATASTVPYFDASKNIISSAVTPTELGYLSGVTSAIQTQLNAKQASDAQLTSLASLSFTGNALKVVRVNAGETDFELASISGTGDVVGPSSATDEAIVLFDGTSGKLVKNSTATINTSGALVTASVQPTNGVLAGSTGIISTTAAAAQVLSATTTEYQISTGGITRTVTAGSSYGGLVVRQASLTEAASGTHTLLSGVIIRPPSITNGTATTTNATAVYIEGAPTGTASPTNVYAVWVDAGEVRIDGDIGDTTNRAAKVWATNIESTNMPTVGGTSLSSTFAALAGSTGQVFSVSSLELGNTDTTLSRSSAGVIAVEGVVVPTVSSTNTLSNKRIDPRVVSGTSYTTSTTIDSDATDLYVITAQAGALLFNNPSGTPVQGQKLMVRIKDNGTARALTYGSQFRAIGTALPTTTVISKTLYMGFIYNSTDTKWDLVASAQEA